MNILFPKIKEEDLKKQVEQYDTLSIFKSYRGIAALLHTLFIVLGMWLYFLNLIPAPIVIVLTLMYVVLALFIYLGYKWALVAAMILIALNFLSQIILVALTITDFANLLSLMRFLLYSFSWPLVIWIGFSHIFYKAWKVEKIREEKQRI